MDWSGPGGSREPQPPLVDQERSGPPWTTLRHFPEEEKSPIWDKPPKGRRRDLDHAIGRQTNHPSWNAWAGFKVELQTQFAVIDAKREARIKLKNMKQGKRSVKEYWDEFRLVASEAELDDLTGGELVLGGRNTELQNCGSTSSDEYESTEVRAQWAIWKETKLATVRHIQGAPPTKYTQRDPVTP